MKQPIITMEAKEKDNMYNLVDAAILREIANSVGRRLARDYGTHIEGVTTILNEEGVELRLHTDGVYRDIEMKFTSDTNAMRDIFADVSDDEL